MQRLGLWSQISPPEIEVLLGFTLAAKSFSIPLTLSRLCVTEEYTCNFSKFFTWNSNYYNLFLHDYEPCLLNGILIEIAKHTFSLDNFKISRICDLGREQFFFWQCSPLFSLLRTQPNSLGISFDITRQFLMRLEFSRLTLLSRP